MKFVPRIHFKILNLFLNKYDYLLNVNFVEMAELTEAKLHIKIQYLVTTP
jgi:hypothetical protein